MQIGDDGWSGWCFPFWGKKPPQISLDRIPELISKDSLIWTLQGIPFKWNSDERNIAFTSQYDNYPDSITIIN